MPLPLRARALVGAVLAGAALSTAGCGLEAKPDEVVTKPGDPAPAERALKLYLNDDRCDLLSDDMAEAIDPDPARGRRLCAQGRKPVDMLVRPGEYTVKDAEVIDGKGLIRISLKDGGIRDYTLIPGGPADYLVDQVKSTTTAEYGEPLRLQAREDPASEPVDARITVESIKRVPVKDLSQDEYTSGLDHYYLVRVRIRSRSDKLQLLGSDGFQLATKDGYPIAEPREMYTDLGKPLPGVLRPGKENVGDLFFAAPSPKGSGLSAAQVRPGMVQFIYGDQLTGTRLVWTPPGA